MTTKQKDVQAGQNQDESNEATTTESSSRRNEECSTDTQKRTISSRRSILKTVGILGVGSFSFSRVGVASSEKKSDEKEIDYALRREEPGDPTSAITKRTKRVPRDWYRSLKRSEKVRKRKNFESKPYVGEVDLIPPIHGGAGPQIQVGVIQNPDGSAHPDLPSTQEAKDKIPTEVERIPVDVHEVTEFRNGCYEYDYGDSVPAGAEMEVGYETGYCTMGAQLNKDGNSYFSTCQHIFYNDDPESRKLYNQDDDAAIGDVIESYCTYDFVVAEPINGHTPTYRLANPNGTLSDLTIVEQFTKNALHDKVANDEELTKRGVKTCETTGKIRSANGYIGPVDIGCGFRNHQVKWGKDDGDFDPGDSGSIVYQKVGSDQVAVAGTCNGWDPVNKYIVYGQSAYSIKNNKGYTYI